MRTSLAVITSIFLANPLMLRPQQAAHPTTKRPRQTSKSGLRPAVVSGSVFAITKGGDLKPARIVNVYIFFSHPVNGSAEPNFAAGVFTDAVKAGLEDAKAYEATRPYLKENTVCNKDLNDGYQHAIVKTLTWSKDHLSQALFGETDEEGKFQFNIPSSSDGYSFGNGLPHDYMVAPGVYLVVAIGSAGYNNAVWESEVTVGSGSVANLKMSSPTMSCLKLDSE